MKEEALKLADLMIDVTDCETSEFYRAGQMIRKLVDRIAELEKYEQQIKQMERAYDAHFKKGMESNESTRIKT